MPDQSSRGEAVIRVDPAAVPILTRQLRIGRDGRLADLREIPDDVPDHALARRQAALCDRLLAQLADGSTLTGDREELRDLLADLYSGTDAAEMYEELAAEHHAFAHLLDQLNGSAD
jgi:hypothetical protein